MRRAWIGWLAYLALVLVPFGAGAAPGDLDGSFGATGVVTPIGSGDAFGLATAIDSSGRTVVAGYSFNGTDDDIAVVRYTASGSLDTSFGNGGKVTTAGAGYAMAIDASGRIVVAGHSLGGPTWDVALVRYTASGMLDTTFGSGGKVTTPIGAGDDVGEAVTIDGNGRIVVAGRSDSGGFKYVFAVVGYLGSSGGCR